MTTLFKIQIVYIIIYDLNESAASTNHIEIRKRLIINTTIIIITRNKVNMKMMNMNVMIKQIDDSKKHHNILND